MSSEWPEIFHSKHGPTCDEDFIFTNKQMDSQCHEKCHDHTYASIYFYILAYTLVYFPEPSNY